MAQNVTVGFEKHLLGRYLAELRDAAGMSLAQAGDAWEFNKNKVDAWEAGLWSRARETDLVSLLAVYGVDPKSNEKGALCLELMRAAKATKWYKPYVRNLDGAFPSLDSSASSIISYQQTVIPGALQAPRYIQELNSVPTRPKHEVVDEGVVHFRIQRQQHLAEREVQQTHIIEEAALGRARALGTSIWEEQAHHINEIVRESQGRVAVHVLPTDGIFIYTGSFMVWDFRDPVPYSIAYSEAGLVSQYMDDPDVLQLKRDVYQKLLGASLPTKDSMNLIMKGIA